MPEDPRIARTRRRLKEALLELIDEIGYEEITVERLTNRADVARSTFYAHYGAKEDLLFAGFDQWLFSFAEGPWALPDGPPRFRFSLPLLRHGIAQRKFFQNTIVRGPSHRVRRRFKEILAEVALREMARAGASASDTPPKAGRARAVAGAFLGLLEWWADEGGRQSPEELDRIFQDTVAAVWGQAVGARPESADPERARGPGPTPASGPSHRRHP